MSFKNQASLDKEYNCININVLGYLSLGARRTKWSGKLKDGKSRHSKSDIVRVDFMNHRRSQLFGNLVGDIVKAHRPEYAIDVQLNRDQASAQLHD